jgi:hypothetical protein
MLRTGELDEKVLIVLLLIIVDDLDADRLERDARCEHDEAFSLNTVELSATLRNRGHSKKPLRDAHQQRETR